MKKVSIVIPCFNAENYIDKTLHSIEMQCFDDYEIIVVNDGSNDLTGFKLDDWKKRCKNLKVYHQENLGEAAAYAVGIGLSEGEYIIRHDADDLMMPDRLSFQYNWMKENKDVDVSGSWMSKFSKDDYFEKPVLMPTHLQAIPFLFCFSNQIANPSSIIKRRVAEKFTIPRYKVGSDLALFLEMLAAGHRFGNMPHVTIRYRIHSGQATSFANLNSTIQKSNNIYQTYNPIVLDALGLSNHLDFFEKWRAGNALVRELTNIILENKKLFKFESMVDQATTIFSLLRLYRKCNDFTIKSMPSLMASIPFLNFSSAILNCGYIFSANLRLSSNE